MLEDFFKSPISYTPMQKNIALTTIGPAAERILIVDILRGFALLGVLLANFTTFTYDQLPPQQASAISGTWDIRIYLFNRLLIENKFMALFSILFGYGFGLMMGRWQEQGLTGHSLFLRRLLGLFLIGFIHLLFWMGDILHFYAVCGLFLLFFRRVPTRAVLWVSLLLMFILPKALASFNVQAFLPSDQLLKYQTYRSGSLMELFRINLIGYFKSFIQSGQNLPDGAEALGRFLFGYYLLRKNVFQAIETKWKIFLKVCLWSLPLCLTGWAVFWLKLNGTHIRIFGLLEKLAVFSSAIAYSCLLVLLYIRFPRAVFFRDLSALGRMALSNYLLISTCLVVTYNGIGFGRLGQWPQSLVWLQALIMLSFLILFSTWWQKRFRFGPVEWLWRQFTYGRSFSIRR